MTRNDSLASINAATADPLDIIREPKRAPIGDKEDISFSTVSQIDQDGDLWFQLRGHGYNPLIDAALPLFGLVMRARKLSQIPHVEELYKTVSNQIATIGEEVSKHPYDHATQLAYRYCLCSFIDEAVMGTPWGSQSVWAERSLLSAYHDETWGGEKFFTIMSRMLMDQEKYQDPLEFMYMCLCLGFKGRYGVQMNSGDELQNIISKLQKALRHMRGHTPKELTSALKNVAQKNLRIGRQWPWWLPWVIAGLVLLCVFIIYSITLGKTSNAVLESINTILR